MIELMTEPDAADGRSGVTADEVLVELYRAHYRSLVRRAALLLDDRESSEEVVQDAYVRVHGAYWRLRDPEKALAYLRQSVVNGARSRLRRRRVARRHAPKPMPDAPSAEYGALLEVERSTVIAALHALPPRQREAVVLRYYGDLSEAEIARAMGISAGTVKSAVSRGLAALSSHVKEQA